MVSNHLRERESAYTRQIDVYHVHIYTVLPCQPYRFLSAPCMQMPYPYVIQRTLYLSCMNHIVFDYQNAHHFPSPNFLGFPFFYWWVGAHLGCLHVRFRPRINCLGNRLSCSISMLIKIEHDQPVFRFITAL